MHNWKQYAITAVIALIAVGLAESGMLSFLPGMPPKKS